MKSLAIVLFIVCIAEAYFVVEARKERDFYYQSLNFTRDNYINANVITTQINLKIAQEMGPNPANALDIMNKLLCSGNPLFHSYTQIESVPLEIKANLQSMKEQVDAYCKK